MSFSDVGSGPPPRRTPLARAIDTNLSSLSRLGDSLQQYQVCKEHRNIIPKEYSVDLWLQCKVSANALQTKVAEMRKKKVSVFEKKEYVSCLTSA